MYRVLICDRDDRFLRRVCDATKAYMSNHGEPCGVTRCADDRALRRIMEKQDFAPDILIIDPQFAEGSDGFALADSLQKRYRCQLIFISAHPECVFDAYNVTHVWFVRKVELDNALRHALEKACENLNSLTPGRIALRADHRSVVVDKRDILYAEQTLRRIHLVCADGEEYVLYSKMDDMLLRLREDYFVRCHKSYFVNAAAVQEFSYSRIVMRDGREIPISKTYAHSVSEQLSGWFEPNTSEGSLLSAL